MKISIVALAIAVGISGCGGSESLRVQVETTPFNESICEGAFVKSTLPHVTTGASLNTTLFDGTGAGLAVGDLNGDGWQDIVIANLSGESSVFMNRTTNGVTGPPEFERSALATGRYRSVAIVDVDGDGGKDIVMTTGVGRPVAGINDGSEGFVFAPLAGVDAVAYSMAWSDLGGDGDLDLVTGAYNAELTASRDVSALLGTRGGVWLFENVDGARQRLKLTGNAQALAIRIADINFDGMADIHVGNDLITPDEVWLSTEFGWKSAAPFSKTTFSTMSLDGADIDNDGRFEVLATDMNPMDDDPATVEAWEPVMQDMRELPRVDDIQSMENVLSAPTDDQFIPITDEFGIGPTGWSWSGEFGDLDNDGFVDLYVVNGMESEELFGHISPSALIEANQAYRNVDGDRFVVAPEWELGDTDGGRGMVMADLDRDGDLDIVVNNLNAPSAIFENRLCTANAVTIDLVWEGTGNLPAYGATVQADTGTEQPSRLVEATRGYLSGYGGRTHIGVGDATEIDLEVTWPDGQISTAKNVSTGNHLIITRSQE